MHKHTKWNFYWQINKLCESNGKIVTLFAVDKMFSFLITLSRSLLFGFSFVYLFIIFSFCVLTATFVFLTLVAFIVRGTRNESKKIKQRKNGGENGRWEIKWKGKGKRSSTYMKSIVRIEQNLKHMLRRLNWIVANMLFSCLHIFCRYGTKFSIFFSSFVQSLTIQKHACFHHWFSSKFYPSLVLCKSFAQNVHNVR